MLESRSRISQPGSRCLAWSRIYHSYTPTLETLSLVGRHAPRSPKDIYPWCFYLIYQRRSFTTKKLKPTYLGKISQYFWHFISSLSTTDIDNDVGVWKLGQRLRDDSLSTTKGTWDSCCPTLHTSKIATTTKARVFIVKNKTTSLANCQKEYSLLHSSLWSVGKMDRKNVQLVF